MHFLPRSSAKASNSLPVPHSNEANSLPGRCAQQARSHFEKADRLMPDHVEYSYWAARLAELLGDYPTAARRYEAVLVRLRVQKGDDAPEIAGALENLAEVYRAQGRFEEAEPLLKRGDCD